MDLEPYLFLHLFQVSMHDQNGDSLKNIIQSCLLRIVRQLQVLHNINK
jgi:hypothetical protein